MEHHTKAKFELILDAKDSSVSLPLYYGNLDVTETRELMDRMRAMIETCAEMPVAMTFKGWCLKDQLRVIFQLRKLTNHQWSDLEKQDVVKKVLEVSPIFHYKMKPTSCKAVVASTVPVSSYVQLQLEAFTVNRENTHILNDMDKDDLENSVQEKIDALDFKVEYLMLKNEKASYFLMFCSSSFTSNLSSY